MSRDSRLFKDTLDNLKIAGDVAEIGVLTGTTFKVLCAYAKHRKVMAHAIDSFRGMAEPSAKDLDAKGETIYPKGRFDIGGVKKFHECMKIYRIPRNYYTAWEGFVPEVFKKFPEAIRFSYVRLDLDQYNPTKAAAEWALKKLNVGGVLSSHDYFPNARVLAAMAMNDFIFENKDRIQVIGHDQDEVFIRKIA